MALDTLTLFLAGDVMTGRGVDQALPHPSDPQLHEPFVRDARDYLALAERRNGPVGAPLDVHEPWGAAFEEWEQRRPDLRIVNLETSVTTSDEHWPSKGIHYRMHPQNVGCLVSADLDCCTLANNHVLDWGNAGLVETLDTLAAAGIATCGAGRNLDEATAPARFDAGDDASVAVFAVADRSSGVPDSWSATPDCAGVHRIDIGRPDAAQTLASTLTHRKRRGEIVVLSIHWGGNWDLTVPEAQRRFAHALIDAGAVDIVQGHSSHHIKAVECYRGRLIIYGCGDLLTDYEGIGGHRAFRPWVAPAWFVTVNRATGQLVHVDVAPLRVARFRLRRGSRADRRWVGDTLGKRAAALGVRIEPRHQGFRLGCGAGSSHSRTME